MARLLAWIGIAALTVYLILFGGAWFGINLPTLRLFSVLVAGAVLATWLVVTWPAPAWRPRTALWPAIGAVIGSLAVSTVFSRAPRISLEYLGYALVLAALYLLLVRLLASDFLRPRLVGLLGVMLAVIAGTILLLTIQDWIRWWEVIGRLDVPPLRPTNEGLTFGNPSAVLTATALLAAVVVAAVGWSTSRQRLAVAGVFLVTAGIALVSGSRSGWLAIAVAGLVWLVLVAARRETRAAAAAALRRLARDRRLVLLVVAGAAAGVVGIMILAPAILGRVFAGGEGNRIAFARIALQLFQESPVVGTGPGTWVIERPGLTLPTEPNEYIPHAHNLYAQTLGELGLVGAVAGVVVLIAVVRLLRGGLRHDDPELRRWALVATVSLTYFAVHQALDFYANAPTMLFLASVPLAYLDARLTTQQPALRDTGRRARVVARSALTLLVGVAVGGLAIQELPALQSDRAVGLANVGTWAEADGPARAAADADPDVAAYAFTAGLTAAHAGDMGAAEAYFSRVVARDDVPEAWLNLAAVQAQLGDAASARASLARALRLGVQQPAIGMAAGELAQRVSDEATARSAFTVALAKLPTLAGDPWWRSAAEREAALEAALADALESMPPATAWELPLMAGDTERARAMASAGGSFAVDIVDAWTGDTAAIARVYDHCRTTPRDWSAMVWCARVAEHGGDAARANEYRSLANTLSGGTFSSGAEVRIATAPLVGRSLEGGVASFWGVYTYRRFTPWDVLVPQLLHLRAE